MPNPQLSESRIMLLTKQLNPAPRGGREMLCKLNHNALASILGERLVVFELSSSRPANPCEIFNAFRGHIDGLTVQTIDDAINHLLRENVRQVFVDGSNLGGFVATLKRRMKHVEVISFFHNVEARFFWGALRGSKTPRALAILIANFLAERKAARLSDKRICLSDRDSHLLKKLYGKGATHIVPMSLEDKLNVYAIVPPAIDPEPFALFVGGNFYANREGISWFVQHVAPRVDIKVCIVGKGMEDIRAQLEIPGRVEVIGSVDSLAEWYRRARFIIAPIFDGSGMKTKVAEALMHGKKVIGTPEAFSGYEQFASRAGWCCNSAMEFVSAIQAAQNNITLEFDQELRDIYEEHFSVTAATARLARVLREIRYS
jgi:glycosyltransferase involved in cell wall biosynthesis